MITATVISGSMPRLSKYIGVDRRIFVKKAISSHFLLNFSTNIALRDPLGVEI
jgi:hypothetical protein